MNNVTATIISDSAQKTLDFVRNEFIEGSGITENYLTKLIANNTFVLFNQENVKETLGIKSLVLPQNQDEFWGLRGINPKTGEPTTGKKGIQIKTNDLTPDKNGNIPKKPMKYRTPKGGDSDVICLPLPGGESWQDAIERTRKLVLTEGGKKAASVISNSIISGKTRFPVVNITGVNCGTSETSKGEKREFLEYLLSIAKEVDAEIIISFDMDSLTNDKVLSALIKTHKHLLDMGFTKVFTPIWDDKYKGIDDYLASLPADERLKTLVSNIMRYNPDKVMTLDKLKQIWEKQFAKKKVSASDKKLDGEEIVELILDEYRTNWKWCNQLGYWLHWNGKTWDKKDNKTVAANTQSLLKSRGIRYGSSSKLNDVVEQLSNDLFVETWEPADRKRYIAFNNGVYDTEISKLLPHQQGYMLTSCLSRDFEDIEVNQEETLEQLLKQYCPEFWKAYSWQFDDDDYKVLKLLAVIAGCLTFQFRHLQAFVQLEGVPGSGKGMFQRILTAIVGERNTTPTHLDKLRNEYYLAEIITAQLVTLADEEKQIGTHGGLKNLTGRDMISFREPYGKPGKAWFDGLLLISNNTPIFTGDTAGIDRRNILIKFTKAVENRNPTTEAHILENEIGALTRIALLMTPEQIKSLLADEQSASRKIQSKLDKWNSSTVSDSVAAWIEECLTPSPLGNDFYVSGSEKTGIAHGLFDDYKEFCEKGKLSGLAINKFVPRLTQHLDFLEWEYVARKTNKGKTIQGVKLNDGSHPLVSTTLEEKINVSNEPSLPSLSSPSLQRKDSEPSPLSSPELNQSSLSSLPQIDTSAETSKSDGTLGVSDGSSGKSDGTQKPQNPHCISKGDDSDGSDGKNETIKKNESTTTETLIGHQGGGRLTQLPKQSMDAIFSGTTHSYPEPREEVEIVVGDYVVAWKTKESGYVQAITPDGYYEIKLDSPRTQDDGTVLEVIGLKKSALDMIPSVTE